MKTAVNRQGHYEKSEAVVLAVNALGSVRCEVKPAWIGLVCQSHPSASYSDSNLCYSSFSVGFTSPFSGFSVNQCIWEIHLVLWWQAVLTAAAGGKRSSPTALQGAETPDNGSRQQSLETHAHRFCTSVIAHPQHTRRISAVTLNEEMEPYAWALQYELVCRPWSCFFCLVLFLSLQDQAQRTTLFWPGPRNL